MVPLAIIVPRFIPARFAGTLIGLAVLAMTLFMYFTATVRRLHDRDKSAWFLILFFGVPSVLQAIRRHDGGAFTLYLFSGGFSSFLDIVCLAISIWMIVELGCLRGSVGANRYGPDPLDSVSTPVDAA